MHEPDQTVVIVGAGPTGLALGAELKRLGISSLILDRLEAGANTSRAAVVHARTLEVLEPLGGRDGFFNPYCTARFTIVATLNSVRTGVPSLANSTRAPVSLRHRTEPR